jgi:hypothetical protein
MVNGAVLLWVFSPGAQNLPNGTLAAYQHLRLLGQDLWPLGVALTLCGASVSVVAVWRGLEFKEARPREESRAAA